MATKAQKEKTERMNTLRAEADSLGLKYASKTSEDDLIEMVADAKKAPVSEASEATENAQKEPVVEKDVVPEPSAPPLEDVIEEKQEEAQDDISDITQETGDVVVQWLPSVAPVDLTYTPSNAQGPVVVKAARCVVRSRDGNQYRYFFYRLRPSANVRKVLADPANPGKTDKCFRILTKKMFTMNIQQALWQADEKARKAGVLHTALMRQEALVV